ncbi:hypothetical protein [Anaerobiospirillum succiniciproducens]|uniref:hypothetical protein n=1 Tax=Anaerobiospirillum succiniciproducens TaxID=13335 RepID=UPI003F8B444D
MMRNNKSLADSIKINRRFLKSVRIDTDVNNSKSLDGFIPLQSSLNILDFMSRTILSGNNYAFTWSGAFGSGKSTLALLLSSLISQDSKTQSKALSFVKDYRNEDGENNIVKVFASRKHKNDATWSSINIVGTNDSLRVVLGSKLQDEFGITLDKNSDAELSSNDLIKWVELLKNQNKRILLVIDELGKFLHHALETHDIYFLQELAEVSSRSEGHLIVLGIMHQSFDAYIATFNKRVVDEWSKVQGRFENLLLSPSVFESLKVVASCISSNGYTSEFQCEDISKHIFKQSKTFENSVNETLNKCLPLHPASVLLLCALSRKSFGQNERTIFGFLNSQEPFSFNSFLNASDADSQELYLPDQLFDYISNNQAMMIASATDGHLYTEAIETLHRIEASCSYEQIALFKTIACIDILGKTYGLSATKDVLESCYQLFKNKPYFNDQSSFAFDFEKDIASLINKKAIIFKKYDNSYACFQGSDFDFETEFQKAYSQTVFDQEIVRKLLLESETIVAKRHYIKTGNLRYFDVELVSEHEAVEKALSTISTNDSIGKVLLVCMNTDEYDRDYCAEVISVIKQISTSCKNTIFAVDLKSHEIMRKTRALCAYNAMSSLPSLAGDKIARRELNMLTSSMESDLYELVTRSLSNSLIIYNGHVKASIKAKQNIPLKSNIKFNLVPEKSFYTTGCDFEDVFHCQSNQTVDSSRDHELALLACEQMSIQCNESDSEKIKDDFAHVKTSIKNILSLIDDNKHLHIITPDIRVLASDIADALYPKAPVIKNELINRNKISSSAAKARRVLMEHMCESENDFDLGFDKTPAEANIYWTVFLKNKLHRLSSDGQSMEFKCDDKSDPLFFNLFKDTIKFIGEHKQVSLLDVFKFWSLPPYGIKDGMHLLLILYFILINKDEVALYNDGVFVTDFSKAITDDLLVNADQFSFKYFGSSKSDQCMAKNIVKAMTDAGIAVNGSNPLLLARSLVAFALRLPMLTQKTLKLSKRAQNLKSQVINASDPIDLLYIKLPSVYEDLEQDSSELTADLEELKAFYPETIKNIETLLFKSLGHDKANGSSSLNERAKNIQSLGNNFKLEQLAGKLAVYSGLISDIEGIITLCTDKPRQSWTDRDINTTLAYIPELAMEFRKAESFAGLRGRDSKRTFLSIVTATPDGNDVTEVVELSKEELKRVYSIADGILKELEKLNYNQSMGVIAKLASMLSDSKTDKE